MDIVYILGKGSKWNDNEIRYSLRSVDKYAKGVCNVFIVGECPQWLQNVTHIPANDPTESAPLNALHKIEVACSSEDIGEDFVLMNDDYYFTRNEDIDLLPWYAKGRMCQFLQGNPNGDGWYYEAYCSSYELLKKMGICNPYDFCLHYPLLINKQYGCEVIEKIHAEEQICLFRTVYQNYFIKRLNHYVVVLPQEGDFKAWNLGYAKMQAERGFLSGSEGLENDNKFRLWIDSLFPYPSRYEKL